MIAVEHFDILVLGGGKGGKTLAMDQAKAGKKVAMVEQGLIGGSCINIACIPTKALVKSASVVASIERAEAFGVTFLASSIDMAVIAARTAAIVAEMVAFNRAAFQASGLELVLGWGRFIGPRTVEVVTESGSRRLTAERIVLNLGTKAAVPPIPGLAAAMPMTHVEALLLDRVPRALIILGGGYIGLEMAQAFRRLGSRVTLVERGTRLARHEDPDVAAAIGDLLQDDGVEIAFGAGVASVEGRSGQAVKVVLDSGEAIEGTHLLVAAGRTPMSAGIGLNLAGVQLDERGFVLVDDQLQTTAAGIWAVGEIAGSPMFTHVSLDDYRVVKSAFEGGSRSTRGRLIPACLFIDPEFARVGLNETEAAAAGIPYRIAKLPMDVVPRARTLSERQGFMKALIARDDDRILGFAMLGAAAGEVMAVVQMAMLGGLPYTSLRDGILAHPTLAEGLNMLFATVRAPS